MDLSNYIPVSEYAKIKDTSVQAVYQKIRRGNLQVKKVGTYTLVKKD